ncbi:hypothetical protein [Caminibacter mediatlanticus]|uniref:DNA polymerase III delta N-terminal domain-containing protein n=1 Tax=Caminibacter mediatlanticus TB-2 TaxID=391592 RepID=A0AAI9AHX5_9BACT|nr:hypothetical protein [Caminibacter mediatlanticus]EDM23920.1 hypothetical protein CMTB2_06691 [Caminibacter mediatlanticus TB-2]
MYKKDFDKLKEYPSYLVLYGDNFFLQEYERKIINHFKQDNIVKLYFDEYDYEEVKSYLIENSLFGNKNIIIIKHNKIPTNIDKLKKFAKNNYLFFFYYGNKKIDIFDKNYVRFFPPTYKEKFIIIEEIAKEYKVSISKEAIDFLTKSVEPIFFRKEIEKLSLYTNNISLDDVKKLVFIYKEESFEELFVQILRGEDFYEMLFSFLETIDYKRIIPALIKYINDLYQYNLYIKKTGNNSLKGYLGYQLPFDIEKQRISLAIKFKDMDYFLLLKKLLEFELKMRNTDKNKEAIFFEAMSFLKNFNSF